MVSIAQVPYYGVYLGPYDTSDVNYSPGVYLSYVYSVTRCWDIFSLFVLILSLIAPNISPFVKLFGRCEI